MFLFIKIIRLPFRDKISSLSACLRGSCGCSNERTFFRNNVLTLLARYKKKKNYLDAILHAYKVGASQVTLIYRII